MDEMLIDFLTESSEHIEGAETQILQFEKDPANSSLIAGIFRLVHTIKGTAGFVGLDRLQAVAHAAETVIVGLRDGQVATPQTISSILAAIDRIKWILSEVSVNGEEPAGDNKDIIEALEISARFDSADLGSKPAEPAVDAPAASEQTAPAKIPAPTPDADAAAPASSKEEGKARSSETIRVTVDTIESIMQLVSELVLTRNQLVEITRRNENEAVKGPLQRLSSLTTDLQDAVMRARMQPVGRLYTNLPRQIRELGAELGKKLKLYTDGADTEIDRQLIDVIRDPLTHLIRNCADHGIERVEDRIAAGKPEHGEIRVGASHEAGQITITISDDGRGLNAEKICAKAVASGLISAEEARTMTPDDINRLIFEPGLSTAVQVSNVSGRGVGMDVVRSNIESIGGTVSIKTIAGKGTTFSLKIPLTLAIAPALIIKAGGQHFALPQHAVVEVVGLGPDAPHSLERVQNALILKLREAVLPAIELSRILGLEAKTTDESLAVIVKLGGSSFAIIVDSVLDVQEIVVKPLSASLAHLKVFSGRTILGDGSVVLILDTGGIAARIGIENISEKKREVQKSPNDGESSTRLILFKAGTGALKALPLSVVARIEKVKGEEMDVVDSRLVMLRQTQLMPIVTLSGATEPDENSLHSLLVIGHGTQAIGLLVDEIVDIVEDRIKVQIEGQARECIGAAEILGKPAEIVDIAYYLELARTGSRPVESRGSVLLVSDNEAFGDVTSPVLSASGYHVRSTTSVAGLTALFEHHQLPDIVLFDLDVEPTTRAATLLQLTACGLTGSRLIGLYSQLHRPLSEIELNTVQHRCNKSDRSAVLSMLASTIEIQQASPAGRNNTVRRDHAA